MNKIKLVFLISVAVCLTTSCNFFAKKLTDQIVSANNAQNLRADSLRAVIVEEIPQYQADKNFAAKMDTVYESGFRLADLSDSMNRNPDNMVFAKEYKKELKFFRNYVMHHFYYSDVINSGLTTIGVGLQMKAATKESKNMPAYMGAVFGSMVKPTVMNIIISCRSQYLTTDTVE